MNLLPITLKAALISLIVLTAFSVSDAQKLPAKQANGLRAPAIVKIDGKPTEWGDFQAYNSKNQVEYLLANDGNNLYLVLKATDHDVVNRIMAGITLSVSAVKFKKDQDALSVLYPLISSKKALFFPVIWRKRDGPMPSTINIDSIMMERNKLIPTVNNLIAVHGAAGVDSVISIYNEDQIKAAGLFDKQGAYIYELAIALKYLNLPAGEPTKLYFHLLINGVNSTYTMLYDIPEGPAGVEFMKMNAYNTSMAASTDFWGEYQLK